jgi:RES domain-containing protein
MSSLIRDSALLDTLEQLEKLPYSKNVWRSVAKGRVPTDCSRSGGRWDDKTFDVLYTSEEKQAAIAERRFHLFMGQPIAPSKPQYELFELSVSLEQVMDIDMPLLASLGLNAASFGKAAYADRSGEYPSTQVIAEACFFLGADGILVECARHDSKNFVVFCDENTKKTVDIVKNHGIIEF